MHPALLPYTQSKRLFDRLAPYIGEALRAYPAAIIIDTRKESMSAESFAGYFRKARAAKQMLNYKHIAIDEELFSQHADNLVCAFGKNEQVGKLIVGPRNYGEVKDSVANGSVNIKGPTSQIEVTAMFVDEVCKLVQAKALTPMPDFIVRGMEPEQLEKLMTVYDVTIVPLDETNKLHQIL